MIRPESPVRRAFLQLLASVAVVHVIFIAGYYAFDLSHAPTDRQRWYAWIWMALTVAVVLVGVQRLKRARRRGPRA